MGQNKSDKFHAQRSGSMNTERNELLNQLFEQHDQDIYKRCL